LAAAQQLPLLLLRCSTQSTRLITAPCCIALQVSCNLHSRLRTPTCQMTAATARGSSQCGGEQGSWHAQRQLHWAPMITRQAMLVRVMLTSSHHAILTGEQYSAVDTPKNDRHFAHMLQGALPEVLAAASRILGAPVANDQPLMEAGLDSLGMHFINWNSSASCARLGASPCPSCHLRTSRVPQTASA
jgi:hypothetical protein